MYQFLSLLFLVSYGYCCSEFTTCKDCLSDSTDCFWAQSFIGEMYCTTEKAKAAAVIHDCHEDELPITAAVISPPVNVPILPEPITK